MDLDLRFAEIQRDKAVRDSYAFVEDSKSVAREEGQAKGLKKGRKEGMLLVALNMLKNGLEVPLIAKLTKLSETEIKKLKKE